MKELLELFESRRRAMHVPHAVATVLRVEGSSYRRPGARMLINAHGRVAGSISGGCLEKNVIAQGQRALLDGTARLLPFDTTDSEDLAFGSSLGCQGKIWIGIEVLSPRQPWLLEKIVDHVRQRRRAAALITTISESARKAFFETTALFAGSIEASTADPALQEEAFAVLENRKSRFVGNEMNGGHVVEWLGPPISLVIFGAGLDVPPLVRLAHILGHEITVIDRRRDFALPENFPEAHRVVAAKPHEIAQHFSADDRTVAVVMNHHYDTDRDVLAALLPLHLPYIAMLGPKRRTERILSELQTEGHQAADAKNRTIHGPAGLDLGAETPEQIALAILAEIQATFAGRAGSELRHRNAPIHSDHFLREDASCALQA
jgi:xanthine dehydrogenase accessory factor